MAWTDIFGGQTVNPQDLSYKSYSFAANVSLLWDNTTAEANRVVADIMDIAATVAGVTVTMPDARQAGSGEASLVFNAGAESFSVATATGVAIITIAPGEAWYVWLRDNTTQSGLWRAIEFGAGTSTASAASLASLTVKASGTSLVQAMPVRDVNSAYTVGDGDRGRLIRWTGGVGTVTLPLAATVGGDWFAALRNDGTGALTIARSGSDLIDAASSLTLNPTESAMLVTDGTGYFTITKTIALNNAFTLTSIAVAGTGDYTLSSAEQGFSSYVFTGILTGNRSIIVPDTVAPYRVRNSTSGSFTLTVKTASGTGVVVDQANAKFLTCDGTNVFDQVTAGIATPIAIADGGTGATTASAARTNLGATSLGGDLFTTVNAAAARTSLGATATGSAVLTAADAAAARTALALGTAATQTVGTSANNVVQLDGSARLPAVDGSQITGISIPAAFPTGGIILWSGAVAAIPSGWALCDGTSGTPDLRNRFVVGAGSSYAVDATGGADSVTLTTSQIPAHSHTGTAASAGAHSHTVPYGNQDGASGDRISRTNGFEPAPLAKTTSSAGAHTHSLTIDNTGGGGSHENRPPYYALAYIMKV